MNTEPIYFDASSRSYKRLTEMHEAGLIDWFQDFQPEPEIDLNEVQKKLENWVKLLNR